MSKISIVIAAYNVEQYIAETLESVLAQTWRELEVLVIDDCSTDSTPAILRDFAERDARVRVIRQPENHGAMMARKRGVEEATGDYIMFLDGDDMYAPDACASALAAIEREGVDLLQFDTEILTDDDSEETEARGQGFLEYLKSSSERISTDSPCGLLDDEVEHRVNFTVWNKIYRAELLKRVNAYVPDEYLNFAEDVLFSFLVQHSARSYAYLPKKLYIYRFGCGISTRTLITERQLRAWIKCAFVYNYLERLTRDLGTYALCREAVGRIKRQMLDNLASLFLHRILPEQKETFLEEAKKYCSVEDFILAISDYTYRNAAVAEDLVAEECASLELFKTERRPVKRIGVYYFRMYNGGVENVISSLSDIWVKRGYEVVIFTDEEPSEEDYPVPASVRRIKIPDMKKQGFDALEARIRGFRQAIIESGIDIMVYNAWISPYLLVDGMTVKSCGVALTVHTHNLFCCDAIAQEGIYAYRNTALAKLYLFADSIVTLTDVDTAWWQAHGIRAIKTVNPVWLPLTVERSDLSGHRMVMVCRISPEKQVLDAIKIAELVREKIPDATLTIVGKGDYKEYVELIEDYVKDNGLEEFVDLAGFTSNVLPCYQNADLLLSTSRYEGFGLALVESKICGLPMVCYELPNLDITRESCGMAVIPQGDRRAAADAIISIFSDEEKKRCMGREARESAERICGTDLGAIWDHILAETMKPQGNVLPLYQRTPLEIAANLATEFHSRGIFDRMQNAQYGGESYHYAERCRILSDALEEIGRSESYRVGLAVTALPRAIARLIRRRKRASAVDPTDASEPKND